MENKITDQITNDKILHCKYTIPASILHDRNVCFSINFAGSSKKSSKHQTKAPQTAEANAESGLDLSDLDLSSIKFSEKEMEALSGLTPALSRRLQQQLLAHLPPAAARSLRRTLSLQGAASPRDRVCVRSHSATKSLQTDSDNSLDQTDKSDPLSADKLSQSPDPVKPPRKNESPVTKDDSMDVPIPQFSTLPRLKRHSALSRETTPPAPGDLGSEAKLGLKESNSRGSSIRSTPDRPLLSKYLTPDRTYSLDESYSSDSGSILSEPSYIAAYGQPGSGSGLGGFRRHSMRATASDQPRKRISRFLRPDFFDTPPDESQYAKLKKEKELETQKVLKEIREKKNKPYDPNTSIRSPVEPSDVPLFKDDIGYARKGLSPLGLLTAKERSRSTTPFFPILDNIKETILDTSSKNLETNLNDKLKTNKAPLDDIGSKESKLTRPKSYPVKTLDSLERGQEVSYENDSQNKDSEIKDTLTHKESKLARPKSYPTSSPSPEKVYVKSVKKEQEAKTVNNSQKTEVLKPESATDVEVSFSISLPKKIKAPVLQKADSVDKSESNSESASDALVLKKYQVTKKSENKEVIAKSEIMKGEKKEIVDKKQSNGRAITNGSTVVDDVRASNVDETTIQVTNHENKNEDVKLKSADEPVEKKTTIKKRIIKKVSSKSKADMANQDGTEPKVPVEKKKVTKKVKEKSVEGETKPTTVKKKSVLQSIGQKIEKLTSNKSSSPDKEKVVENKTVANEVKKDCKIKDGNVSRTQRECSVPVDVEPTTESNLIKRAVTLTDVAALESPVSVPNKTTVSKVLGLFKKFETKEKVPKPTVEKSPSDNIEAKIETGSKKETVSETDLLNDKDKPKRPTSLLLNGLGRKGKYSRTSSDSVSISSVNNDEQKKDSDSRRNSLKLDFSRLPRVKKIVPTNPVIEPQISYSDNKESEERNGIEKNGTISDAVDHITSLRERSRSRSRSTFSNADIKPDHVVTIKVSDEPAQSETPHPHRERTPTTPEKEDIVERIRRKSFYSRFNEKKARRKSNLVGPGAAEYDPVARLHGQTSEPKYDMSPTSPLSYDLSPGFSGASDLSPSTERYRSLMSDLPVSPRSALRFDSYGLNDKVDSYRSLDRNEFRKYPGSRSYLDYDQPSSYGANRYARTMSLMDSSDGSEDPTLGHLRDPYKYNRTISMYSPGSYATYRPKRTRNSAIILKENEKEPSPENILEKIRQRKTISISVTRKPDPEKTPTDRCVYPCTLFVNNMFK